jgi:ParB family chromosome partitioning protein
MYFFGIICPKEKIRTQGIIQPLVVREVGLSQYEIIAGERRWRAAQLAELTEVPVVIRSITDEDALAIGLIENIQRENLNPIEEAQGLRRLIDEFALTHESIASMVGRSRSSISNSLRLLGLTDAVQDMVSARQLEMGHARALLSLGVIEQLSLARACVAEAWSVREVERRVKAILEKSQQPVKKGQKHNPDVEQLRERLIHSLGVNVDIKSNDKNKGRMVLHFGNLDEFDGLLTKLGVK